MVGKIFKIIKRGGGGGGGVGISGVVGKNVKCEHSIVVINVAYSKLKLQLHFRITFLLLSQLTFQKINKRGGGGGGIRAGGLEKFGKFGGGTLIRCSRVYGLGCITLFFCYYISYVHILSDINSYIYINLQTVLFRSL